MRVMRSLCTVYRPRSGRHGQCSQHGILGYCVGLSSAVHNYFLIFSLFKVPSTVYYIVDVFCHNTSTVYVAYSVKQDLVTLFFQFIQCKQL